MASLYHSFAEKRVLVTGGAQGIGEAIARKFYADGAVVFVLDKEEALLAKLKNELPNLHTICQDLTDWNGTQAAIYSISPLDHLVNNAAINVGRLFLTYTKDDFEKIFAVNVGGVVCTSQAFVLGNQVTRSENGTTIVNMSSIGATVGSWGQSVYGASKGAVTTLTKNMAVELGEMGIRVNCVCPYLVPSTGMAKGIDPALYVKAEDLLARSVLKGSLEVNDVADAVLFLSSPLSSKITGTSLLVDMGASAH